MNTKELNNRVDPLELQRRKLEIERRPGERVVPIVTLKAVGEDVLAGETIYEEIILGYQTVSIVKRKETDTRPDDSINPYYDRGDNYGW